MNALGEYYVLEGMVRSISHHFTVALKDDTSWVNIDDMCVSVRSYASFQALLYEHFNGWFSGIQYLKSLQLVLIIIIMKIIIIIIIIYKKNQRVVKLCSKIVILCFLALFQQINPHIVLMIVILAV